MSSRNVITLIKFLFEETVDDKSSLFIAAVEQKSDSRVDINMTRLNDKRVHIDQIAALQPGHGHGSLMLQKMTDLADRFGITLSLEVETAYDTSDDIDLFDDSKALKLINWYARHGFETSQAGDYGLMMIREPRKQNGQS